MPKLLTIVVPAYNMHDYLHRCLDSICVESVMDDVQVIVVNDGSTDDTSQIAHSYESRYPHYFQVIDKENGNYGSCMNVALPLAEGKYFRTLDADDWYDTEAYVKFVDELKVADADMVMTEKVDHYAVTSTINEVRFDKAMECHKVSPIDDINWNNKSLKEMMGVMFLTYRTSILRKKGMLWLENISFTDFQYCIQPLQYVKSVCFLPLPVYQYQLEREGQSVSLAYSVALKNTFGLVSEIILKDFLLWKDHVSESVRTLVLLKFGLLLPNYYRTLYFDGVPTDNLFHSIESMVVSDNDLKELTNSFDEYRGIRYVSAFRKSPLLLFFIHLDYKLRSSTFLRTIFKR